MVNFPNFYQGYLLAVPELPGLDLELALVIALALASFLQCKHPLSLKNIHYKSNMHMQIYILRYMGKVFSIYAKSMWTLEQSHHYILIKCPSSDLVPTFL